MAYQIKEIAGCFQVVVTMNGGKTIGRVVGTCATRTDAQRLVADLAGWVL